MKPHLYLTIALTGIVFSTAALFALPDRVGTFIIGSLPLEDFALDEATWESDKLVGEWKDQSVEGTDDQLFELVPTLLVFGVKADEVTAVKSAGDLSRFVITYKPDDNASSSAPDRLFKTLKRNIEAYTGEKLVETSGAKTPGADYHCSYKDFEIKVVKPDANRVMVAIRKSAA